MKATKVILKILAAAAAVAGVVYVIATYGDKIVAWAKSLLPCCKGDCANCDCTCQCEGDCENDCPCDGDCDETCPCTCQCGTAECEEVAEPKAEESSETVTAEDHDFEG